MTNPIVAPKDSYHQQMAFITAIWNNSKLFGLERWVMLVLATFRLVLPSMVVNLVAARFAYPHNKVVVDVYCILKPVLLFGILKLGLASGTWALILACILIADLYVYLLSVIFLGRVGLYGQPASINRSVLLALINFIELAAAFSIVYLNLNALYYDDSVVTNWHQAVYFSVITAMTIGYGDVTPGTPPGRLVTSVHAFGSLVFVGVVFTLLVSRISLEGPRQGSC